MPKWNRTWNVDPLADVLVETYVTGRTAIAQQRQARRQHREHKDQATIATTRRRAVLAYFHSAAHCDAYGAWGCAS